MRRKGGTVVLAFDQWNCHAAVQRFEVPARGPLYSLGLGLMDPSPSGTPFKRPSGLQLRATSVDHLDASPLVDDEGAEAKPPPSSLVRRYRLFGDFGSAPSSSSSVAPVTLPQHAQLLLPPQSFSDIFLGIVQPCVRKCMRAGRRPLPSCSSSA